MWVFAEPLDVWLFREPRPFTAGEQLRATGLFPPLPLTFKGALRAAALAQRNMGFGDLSKRRDESEVATIDKKLRVRGPFVGRRDGDGCRLFLPTPLDLFVTEGDEPTAHVAKPAELGRGERVGAELPWDGGAEEPRPWPGGLRLCLTEEADLVPWEGTLEAKDYRRYLLGELDGQKLAEESRLSRDLVRADLRLGIERDRVRGTVQRGRLYMAHFHRPTAGVGLAAEVWVKDGSSGPPLKRKGYLALGGEARAARYRTIQSPLGDLEDEGFKEALRKRLEKGRRFKLVLATPTVLAHGWCPGFVERNLKGAVAGVPVRLVAATVGKALPVGGWDFGGRKPKPLRLAAPAGSVFHFEVANEARDGWPDALLQQVHGKSLCDGPLETRWGDYRRVPGHEVGMGITFVGVWDGV